MLTRAGCRQRTGQLLERTRGECGVIVIADPRHIGYLSGFFTNPATINLPSQSFLVIEPDGRSILITDNWQAEAASRSHADAVKIFDWYTEEQPAGERRELAVQTLTHHLHDTQLVPRCVGIERNVLMTDATEQIQRAFPGVEFQDIWSDLIEMRRAKYPDEVECIRRAVHACEVAYGAVRLALQPGLTELELYATAYRTALIEAGEPITAVGDFISGVGRTAAGTGAPTWRVMQSGELFIMDFFVQVGGYRGDLCNTFVVGGQPFPEQRQRFHVLERAQAAAQDKLRPGITTREIYQTVADEIKAAGLGETFWGHVGHGLGIDHPEAPFIVRDSEEILQAGDVITVEPGFYLQGWGGMRIEDDYLVTSDGCERLSHHLKGL